MFCLTAEKQTSVWSGIKKRDICILFVLFILVLVRVWLAYITPVYANVNTPHDEACLMNMTKNIIAGNWLGAYSEYTMMKGMTWSLFCAICALTRIPYTILLSMMHIISSFVFVWTIRGLIRCRYIRYVVFIFMIYLPITFCDSVVQRLYRNSLTIPLVLFIFSGFLGIYFCVSRRSMKNAWAYSILAGLSLFFFWNLREDSVWILPFVVAISIFSIIFILIGISKMKKPKIDWIKRPTAVVLPFVLLLVGNLVISSVNYSHYGIFAINDRTETAFNDVLEMFIKIDYDDTDLNLNENECFMSEEKFEYIIDHSESLSLYKEIFLNAYRTWAQKVCKGNYVLGDHIQWSFRLGLDWAGLYEDGRELQEYLICVSQELQEQIDNGELSLKSGVFLSSSTRMIQMNEISVFLGETLRETVPFVLSYESISAKTLYSIGETEELRSWEFVVNSYLLYPDEEADSAYALMSDFAVKIENHIIAMYQAIALPLTLISFVIWICMTCLQISNIKWKNRRLFERWIFLCSVLVSAVLLLFIFVIFSCWNPSLPIPYYCSGAYILLGIFQIVAVCFGAESAVRYVRMNKWSIPVK